MIYTKNNTVAFGRADEQKTLGLVIERNIHEGTMVVETLEDTGLQGGLGRKWRVKNYICRTPTETELKSLNMAYNDALDTIPFGVADAKYYGQNNAEVIKTIFDKLTPKEKHALEFWYRGRE